VTGYYEAPARLRPAPDLRVVPLDTIWVHEDPGPSRFVALRDAIGKQGVLENPVVVGSVTAAAADRHRFVHLDGANRIAALRALGCTHVVVQVVDLHRPQHVRLSAWAHRAWVDPVAFSGIFSVSQRSTCNRSVARVTPRGMAALSLSSSAGKVPDCGRPDCNTAGGGFAL
jgi:hypothetical protein